MATEAIPRQETLWVEQDELKPREKLEGYQQDAYARLRRDLKEARRTRRMDEHMKDVAMVLDGMRDMQITVNELGKEAKELRTSSARANKRADRAESKLATRGRLEAWPWMISAVMLAVAVLEFVALVGGA